MAEGGTGRNKFARRGAPAVALPLVLVLCGVHAGCGQRAAEPPVAATTALPAAAASAGIASAPADAASTTQGRIEFASGSARLPADASDLLVRIADAARLVPGCKVEIVAWRPAGADSLVARERAEAARHALEANGVLPGQMRVVVQEAPAGTAAAEAERVELQVR